MNEEAKVEVTNIRIILGAIWKQIFDEENDIGIDEDFYDLGGNSLLSTEIKIAIKETFDVEIKVEDVYEYTTIRALADFILKKHQGDAELITG